MRNEEPKSDCRSRRRILGEAYVSIKEALRQTGLERRDVMRAIELGAIKSKQFASRTIWVREADVIKVAETGLPVPRAAAEPAVADA